MTVAGAFAMMQADAQWTGTNPVTTTSNVGIGPSGIATPARLNIQSGFNIEDAGTGCYITNNTGPALRIHWAVNDPSVYGCYGTPAGAPNILEVTTNSYMIINQPIASLLTMNSVGELGVGIAPTQGYRFNAGGRSLFDGDVQLKGRVRITNSATLTTSNWNAVPYNFSVDVGNSRFVNNVHVGTSMGFNNLTSYKLAVEGAAVSRRMVVESGSSNNDAFSVQGKSVFDGPVLAANNFQVNGSAVMANGLSVGSALTVGQTATISGNTSVGGNTSIGGTLRVGPTAASGSYNGYRLSVDGNIICKRAVVQTVSWADFVFDSNYQLPPLAQVEAFVKSHRHLPGVPTEAEVRRNGVDVGEMNKILLQKVEELTLYVIELQKKTNALQQQLEVNAK